MEIKGRNAFATGCREAVFLVMCAVLMGCTSTSGTHLVTGAEREAISVEQVVIYPTFPEEYEVIGPIRASSKSGWTNQKKLDKALAELKRQAAKIGANGIVIDSIGDSSDYSMFGTALFSKKIQAITGTAIYVPSAAH